MFETRTAQQRVALLGSAVALCVIAAACAPSGTSAPASSSPAPPPATSGAAMPEDPVASQQQDDANSAPTGPAPGAPSDPAAQDPAPEGQAMQPPPSAAEPVADDERVTQFARAYADVARLQSEYQGKAAQAESQAEVTELSAEMNEEIRQSVLERGMTIDDFNTLASRLESDPELRNRVSEELESL